jgi:IS605 OrfB family transposase
VFKKIRELAPDARIVTCAVDLAVRHIGAMTIAREGEVFARRILHHRAFVPGGGPETALNIPSLPEIAQVKRQVQRARRRTGRIAPYVQSCAHLQRHYRRLCEDRFKKTVAAVFQFARFHGASLVIFEDLKRLLPDAANERGVNSALQSWNRRQIVNFAQNAAEEYGLRVVCVPAYFTSTVCARCGCMGGRFDRGVKRKRGEPRQARAAQAGIGLVPEVRHGVRLNHLGHWFACPSCRRQIHADINASENLHKVWLGTFPKCRSVQREPRVYEINGTRVQRDEVRAALTAALHPSTDEWPF